VTRYNLPPADDPSSIESLLRTRKSQLAAGRRAERVTATADHDGDELLRLLRTMPPDLRLTVAPGENLAHRGYRYLKAHGWKDEEIRAACAEVMHPVRQPVLTDSTVTAGAGVRGPTRSRPPSLPSASAELVRQHAARALAAGTNPRVVKRWERQQLARLVASAGPDRPFPVAGPPVAASFSPLTDSTTSGANRDASGGRRGRRG
jgi:hypothetical protein